SDTAQLNHFNPALREALLNELHTIAQHCDGVRCDMAMLALNDIFAKTWSEHLALWPRPEREFWTEAVEALTGFLWLGEVYWDREWELQQLGFHYTYDKRLYDRLRTGSATEVVAHLSADWDFQRKLVRFLENHDEPRSPVAFGKTRLPGVATLFATLPGMRFYHQGQLEGRTRHLPIQLRRAADETPDRLLCRWYERLLELTRDEVFHTGEWRLLPVEPSGDDTSRHLIAYQWRRHSTWAIVVVNLGREPAQGNVVLSDELEVNGASGYVLIDRLHGQAHERPTEELRVEGLYVSLDPYWAHLFTVTPVRKRQGPAGFAQDSLKGGRHG
ncbi:MAG: alpha-amylase, partial [Nitrospirales bacterium]